MCFFFTDTSTPEIYTLSLHDALPSQDEVLGRRSRPFRLSGYAGGSRSGESSVPAVRLMASKTEETPQKKEEMPKKEGPETRPVDLSDTAIKKLIRSAKKRGYVTH